MELGLERWKSIALYLHLKKEDADIAETLGKVIVVFWKEKRKPDYSCLFESALSIVIIGKEKCVIMRKKYIGETSKLSLINGI